MALPTPEVAVVDDRRDGDVGTLVLRLRSPWGATDLDVLVRASGLITSAAVDGKTLDLREYPSARDGVLRLSYNGIEQAGFELALSVGAAEPINIAVTETSDSVPVVPGMVIQPRPAAMMPAPGTWRDPMIVKRTFTY